MEVVVPWTLDHRTVRFELIHSPSLCSHSYLPYSLKFTKWYCSLQSLTDSLDPLSTMLLQNELNPTELFTLQQSSSGVRETAAGPRVQQEPKENTVSMVFMASRALLTALHSCGPELQPSQGVWLQFCSYS